MKRAYLITRDGQPAGTSTAEGPLEAIDLHVQCGFDRDGYYVKGPYAAFLDDNPRNRGIDAGLAGIPIDMNPYPRSDHINSDFLAWRGGWAAGNLERSKPTVMKGAVGG